MKLPDYNATMEELIDHVAKLQKHVQFLMEGNLGSKNIREVGDFLVGQKSFASRDGMVGISSLVAGQENVRFWAGAANPNVAPYRVYDSGRLVAQNADIQGSVKMGAGSSISWNDVNSDPLAISANNTAISAVGLANAIANGKYTGGTFINQEMIISPQIITGTLTSADIVGTSTITGAVITGGTFMTNPVGSARLELNLNRFMSINSLNQLHGVVIDPVLSNGGIDFYNDGVKKLEIVNQGINYAIRPTMEATVGMILGRSGKEVIAQGVWDFDNPPLGVVARFG